MCFFLTGLSCFWKRFCQPFLDLKNSKAGTHVYKLLNLSDVKKVAKTFVKNTKYYKTNVNLHATLDSQVPFFLGFLPPGGRKIVITRRSWQLQTNLSSNFAPGGRKIVITRRSWQLQSSYFACADLWTCWIRFWYSRSPKLTKIICFWRFFKMFMFISSQTMYIFQFWGSAAWGFSLSLIHISEPTRPY